MRLAALLESVLKNLMPEEPVKLQPVFLVPNHPEAEATHQILTRFYDYGARHPLCLIPHTFGGEGKSW